MPPETAPAYLVSYTDVVCEGVEQAPSRSVRRPPLHVRPPRRRQTSPHSSKFYPRETGQRETRYVPPVFCDVHSRMASTRLNTRPSSQCTPCQSQSSMTRTLTSTQWVSVSVSQSTGATRIMRLRHYAPRLSSARSAAQDGALSG